tara:strand:+ start:74 stop:1333 length:1260 start_codon:yes stop_codon:yes gene_type:complete
MPTFVNNLRLKEMATGEETGTWGTSTNANLELIADALGFGTEALSDASTHTTTVLDGGADPARAIYQIYTGTLSQACTITIAPDDMKRVHIIKNGTSGSQNILIKQGSGGGAAVTIPPGDTKVVSLDGGGSSAIVTDVFASLSVVDLKVEDDLTVSDDLLLSSDSSVISMGADADATLTHDGTTGLTIAATPISIDSTGELHLNSTTGDIKLQDGGTDQIAFDLDGTAGEVIMKPAVDSDDLVISQFDGTEVIRVEDNASLGLVGNKLNIANSSSDVIIKPLTDAKDIIFQQFDGTAVMTVEDNVSLAINNDITVAGRASGHVHDNTNSFTFDLSVANDFKTESNTGSTITFSNVVAGQSGNIMLVNGGNHAIIGHDAVAVNADVLSTISATGTYHLAYFVTAASGNNTILVSASAALT